MRAARKRRLWMATFIVMGVAAAAALALTAFQKNVLFFFSPSDVMAGQAPQNQSFRLGGLVIAGSLKRLEDGLTVEFIVTDLENTVPVRYSGILPDLFREGKGVVAQGQIGADGIFSADEVLAKHDENYMPPEVADALERSGHPVGEDESK
jgi:cytochrome c-type biogenesis protein CcmE